MHCYEMKKRRAKKKITDKIKIKIKPVKKQEHGTRFITRLIIKTIESQLGIGGAKAGNARKHIVVLSDRA